MLRTLAPLALLAAASCSATDKLSGTCAGVVPFSIGSTASGTGGSDECAAPNGDSGHLYSFSLSTQANVQFTLNSNGFEGGLAVYPGKATTGAATSVFDVSANGAASARTWLPAGDYFMVVSAVSGSGAYSLTTQTAEMSDCSVPGWARPGVTISGTVTASDCDASPPAKQDIYQVNMTAGQTVSVNAQISKSGAVLWRTGNATSADLITKSLPNGGTTSFTFTAPSAGAFRVHLLSSQPSAGPMSYTVSIQ